MWIILMESRAAQFKFQYVQYLNYKKLHLMNKQGYKEVLFWSRDVRA